MTKPDVSIIVAVYNAEDYIGRCLDSLIAQTYKNIEIICVNDASTDHSQQIIDSYILKDDRIHSIVHPQNMNAGGAMNDGIKAAQGEYVCIVDNDDWLASNAVEELYKASDNCRFDIITCDWITYSNDNIKKYNKNLTDSLETEENVIFSLINGCRILGALIRKHIFIENSLFFPEKVFYEDNAIATCILCYANKVYPVHKPYYFYFLSENSVTRSVSKRKIVDRIYTTDLFLSNMYSRGFVNEKNKKYVEYRYLMYSYRTIELIVLLDKYEKGKNKLVKKVGDKIKKYLPNELMENYHPEKLNILKHPIYFYHKILIAKFLNALTF